MAFFNFLILLGALSFLPALQKTQLFGITYRKETRMIRAFYLGVFCKFVIFNEPFNAFSTAHYYIRINYSYLF